MCITFLREILTAKRDRRQKLVVHLILNNAQLQNKSFSQNIYNEICIKIENYFFSDGQLAELISGKDIEKIFLKENFSQKNRDRQIFKKSLQVIGRNDLALKIVRGQSK